MDKLIIPFINTGRAFNVASAVFCTFLLINCAASKEDYNDILNTKDIQKIEVFLKNAHPEDPRRSVLKPKLIALKNAEWVKGRSNHKPMAPRPVVLDIPNAFFINRKSTEAEEFKKLMLETSTAHQQKTVKLLNQLFDNDPPNKEAIILVQNNSDCNMIMRIQGKEFYNIAIPANAENTLVVKKGEYIFSSDICGIKYTSNKTVSKSIMIILNNGEDRTSNRFQNTIKK